MNSRLWWKPLFWIFCCVTTDGDRSLLAYCQSSNLLKAQCVGIESLWAKQILNAVNEVVFVDRNAFIFKRNNCIPIFRLQNMFQNCGMRQLLHLGNKIISPNTQANCNFNTNILIIIYLLKQLQDKCQIVNIIFGSRLL